MKLFPSVLSADFLCPRNELDSLAGVVDQFHLDVMDGHFVPNISFGPPVIESITENYPGLNWDAHLMIDRPETYFSTFIDMGMDYISVHVETDPDLESLRRELLGEETRLGLAFNPPTPVSALDTHLDAVDYVVAMTVQPGFSGQSFRQDVLEKIQRLNRQFDGPIQVDGGVGQETIEAAANAGADWFVSGSSIFDENDPTGAANRLRSLLHQ